MAGDRSPSHERRALEVLDSALALDPPARLPFVAEACGDDVELRSRVEALLESAGESDDFLSSPITDATEALPADGPTLVAPGDRFGNFLIENQLGAGGMGEVYKASDTRLGRPVAIKILRPDFAGRTDLRQRFLREARTISNLNHPNICTVYDVGELEGLDYLVMEYLDGATLSERLSRGPLPFDHACEIAIGIAEGLEQAHSVGVVHRDLKPANVMLTSTGAKVLDFGLAKPLLRRSAADRSSRRDLETSAGTILGTPSYMSPQQARGEVVDRQADIWAFGCILYEMLSGKVAHRGDSYADTLVSVLERDPDWEALPASTPRRMRTLLRRCLEKSPRARLHDIADARIEIEECRSGESGAEGAGAATGRHGLSARWAGAMVALAVLAGFTGWWVGRAPVERSARTPSYALSVGLPRDHVLASFRSLPASLGRPSIAISPDGTRIAYVAEEGGTRRLFVRRLDDPDPVAVPGTEGAFFAFFSPEGERIGFFNERGLYRSPLLRGRPIPLDEVGNPVGGAWGVGDTIVYAPDFGNKLFRISAKGGTATEITPPGFLGQHGRQLWPSFLPDGRTILFNTRHGAQIGALSLDTGEVSTLLEGPGTCPSYVASGHLLHVSGSDLYATRMDLESLTVSGRSTPVLAGIRTEGYGGGHYSVSTGGTIVYVTGKDMDRGTLVWVGRDEAGSRSDTAWPGEQKYGAFRLSPGGSRVAVELRAAQSQIWIYELDGGQRSWRITTEGDNTSPLWTPDGRELYFTSLRDGKFHVLRKSADGTGGETTILESRFPIRAQSVSSDGQTLLLSQENPVSLSNLLKYRLGDDKPALLLETPASERTPRFSPDDRWIAYTSDGVPRMEVFVMPSTPGGTAVQVTTNGGEEPVWSSDGREILYRNNEQWMAVHIIPEPELEVGATREVFSGSYLNVPGYSYDYDSIRERFLVIEPSEDPPEIRLITNWFDRLRG